jgi:cytochrome b6-f complex subunit 5
LREIVPIATEIWDCDRFPVEPYTMLREDCNFYFIFDRRLTLIEPILSGIVLGLIPITLAGLFVAAYLQYRRGNQLGL